LLVTNRTQQASLTFITEALLNKLWIITVTRN